MNFCDRLKQEVASSRCAKDAKRVIKDARPQLKRLNDTAHEQLLAELVDIMKELPSA
jgi:hypothetical protein